MPAADFDRIDDVVGTARQHYAKWCLPVIGGVAGLKGAAAGIESDFPGNSRGKFAFEGR